MIASATTAFIQARHDLTVQHYTDDEAACSSPKVECAAHAACFGGDGELTIICSSRGCWVSYPVQDGRVIVLHWPLEGMGRCLAKQG